ncbi:glycosyltransferase family 4 protein [Myroides odoratimimus]|uniref:glycosyltransferase family 4 protein n=1 Tax=Myroides odoratimimus TaxID=76832 RepID=UPI002574C9DB|nr:glycosyltransferase family 4 protein [Myroides odoratimimus]MDM1465220.1 glycosyltransferase family 4 protein [Myroides odoratimimus]MDM1475236.1 glycosyltransferase family 4 protein [Myroides odoratimimus]MDM1485069.1 glycosyltransferase family 4 protein [Myroides odoratimimus]
MKLIRVTTVPQSLRGLLKGQLKFMSNNGFDVLGVSSSGDALEDVAINEGIRTVAIEMTRKISPLRDLRSLIQLIILFYKEKPQIVHTHTPKAGLLGMMAAKIVGVPYRLHTVAGMPLTVATGAKRRLLNQMEKLTYACATKVYPNSYGLERIIKDEKFTKSSKLKVIGHGSSNGIDTKHFDPKSVTRDSYYEIRKNMGISENDFVFLFVGRVVKDKGINELVSAFNDLSMDYSNCHLVLVGTFERDLNPLLETTEGLINNHKRIHAVGFKSNIKDYFAMADTFTFPSYREGFPNVVMQACAMQLNSIVSDINGCNEIIRDGFNGWIVPPMCPRSLKIKMQWCIENRDLSKEMGLLGRDIMKQKYERLFVWESILKEYNLLKE